MLNGATGSANHRAGPVARGTVKVRSVNGALTVTFTTASGRTPTVYSDSALTTTQTLPATVADGATGTFYFASPGAYTMSVKTATGIQIAADLNTTRVINVDHGQTTAYDYDTRLVSNDASGDSGRMVPGTDFAALALPEANGAIGNGTADDTAALQAAVNSLDPTYGGTVWLSAGKRYNFTALNITGLHVTITGPGVLYNGTVYIGVQSGYAPVDMFTRIKDCRFANASAPNHSADCITIANATNIDIEGVRCGGYRALVSFPSIAMGGSNNQHAAKIRISGCRNTGAGNAWAMDYLTYINAPSSGGSFGVGDLSIVDNHFGAQICHVYGTGLDGLKCSNNVFFMPPWQQANATKTNHINITTGDWINVTGNQLFESGYESILLSDPRHVIINGNQIAWPGQRDLKDAISITVPTTKAVRGHITGNHADYYTRSLVAVYGLGDAGDLTIGPNNGLAANVNPQYYGIPSLPSSFQRYSSDSTISPQPRLVDPQHGYLQVSTDQLGTSSFESQMKLGQASGVYSRGKVVSVTAGNTTLGGFLSSSGSSATYGGICTLAAFDGGGTHFANYMLAVGGSASAQTLTVLASTGEITGAAATSPSFTFTIDASGNLKATPVGSTSGSFTFFAATFGNLRFL